jgi:hypothetical protein
VNSDQEAANSYPPSRLFTDDAEPAPDLVDALLPCVILSCVYGADPDPVAVDLTKLALSLETCGLLPPYALDRHIICADETSTDRPPALDDRPDAIDVLDFVKPEG